ncbi:MAG: mannitol dehydrogenase [Armatimonadetes bacterium]|nr:mannitol dehydrogenase [Armatimonadota bacterium]
MNAVQFGAGNIGRGFLGQLLFESGYRTTFIEANPALVGALNRRGEYPLRLASDTGIQDLTIGSVRAIDARDAEAVAAALAEADLAGTSVGVDVLPRVAPTLAAGLSARAARGGGPLNVLLCENQWHAAPLMRDLLLPHLAPPARDFLDTHIGLVETVIGRMVPVQTDAVRAEDPLLIVAEPYKELPVARAMLRGPAPPLVGLIAADDFDAYEARKLFLHNASHAALAYLGWLRGHEFIWQCAEDRDITSVCAAALSEASQALVAEYGFALDALRAFTDDLMRRFANKALGDTVARVAADPLRKLRPNDRLVGAANLCLKHGITPAALAQVIVAALAYDNPDDAKAMELQEKRRATGDAATLRDVAGVASDSQLASLIRQRL